MDEYLCLLDEKVYYDEQYCNIALGQVKIHQIKQLKQFLLKGVEDNKKGNFNNDEFINLIRDMMLKQTEELDELLNLFKIVTSTVIYDDPTLAIFVVSSFSHCLIWRHINFLTALMLTSFPISKNVNIIDNEVHKFDVL